MRWFTLNAYGRLGPAAPGAKKNAPEEVLDEGGLAGKPDTAHRLQPRPRVDFRLRDHGRLRAETLDDAAHEGADAGRSDEHRRFAFARHSMASWRRTTIGEHIVHGAKTVEYSASMSDNVIYTLNARDNILPELLRDYFGVTPVHMMKEIQSWRAEIVQTLNTKGIQYSDLKRALVPSTDRNELALLFESSMTGSGSYGRAISERVMPLFPKDSTHSILDGDLMDHGRPDDLVEAMNAGATFVRNVTFRYHTQFFAVYINNLTDKMAVDFVRGLSDYKPFIGFADMTYMSRLKLYLATSLVNCGIKHKSIILQEHEPDRSNDEDVNMVGWAFEENGYTCKSIADPLPGILLAYKIERPFLPGRERDSEISLNAVSPLPVDISNLNVIIAEEKLKYLQEKKGGSLKRAGLHGVAVEELRRAISEKLSSNYIYNMSYNEEHNTTKFNIVLEFKEARGKPSRHLLALEYIPDKKAVRLITFY